MADSDSDDKEDSKPLTKTIYVRRRSRDPPGREGFLGVKTSHWQTGMVVISLIFSGIVAYKVFWSGRKAQRNQAPPTPPPEAEESEPQLPPQVEGQSIPMVGVPNQITNPHPGHVHIHNGNGHRGFNRYAMPQGPAMSSWAEKMMLDESMKRVPVYQEQAANPPPQQTANTFSGTRENIPVYQYRVPTAPNIGQHVQATNESQQQGDIF